MQHLVCFHFLLHRIPCVRVSCLRCHTCNTVSGVNSPASPKIAGRRSKDSQCVNSSPSYRGDLEIAIAAQFSRRANFCEHVLPRRPHWLRSRSGESWSLKVWMAAQTFSGNSWRKLSLKIARCHTNATSCTARLQRWENQMFGGHLMPVSVSKNFRQVGQCDRTALC